MKKSLNIIERMRFEKGFPRLVYNLQNNQSGIRAYFGISSCSGANKGPRKNIDRGFRKKNARAMMLFQNFLRKNTPDDPDSENKLNTLTGIGTALLIIFLFILGATYLKPLIFGMILAYFFLPLEQFYEKKLFVMKPFRMIHQGFAFCIQPFARIREHFSRKKEPGPLPGVSMAFRATAATFVTALLSVFFLLALLFHFLVPASIQMGKNVNRWATENQVLRKLEQSVSPSAGAPDSKPRFGGRAEDSSMTLKAFLTKIRPEIRRFIEANRNDIAAFAVGKGTGILRSLLSLFSALGVFAFDVVLTLFFFFYFLLSMASGAHPGISPGRRAVDALFGSVWLPSSRPETRVEAAEIIDRICGMFSAWIRGYLSIIILEMVLYITLFSIFSVPYAIPLGMAAGMTILLPFIGPLASFSLTVSVCLGFCDSGLVFTLIGVVCCYLLVNGLLEQLLLYPALVGGAIGLTTLETILVVLIGGYAAGISGMIFAVPTAAVLKFLIPKIYRLKWRKPSVELLK